GGALRARGGARDVVAEVDEQRATGFRDERVAVREHRAVAEEVRRDLRERLAHALGDVPFTGETEVDQFLHPRRQAHERRPGLVDCAPVRRKKHVGLSRGERVAGDDRRRPSLPAGVRPLQRGGRPKSSSSVGGTWMRAPAAAARARPCTWSRWWWVTRTSVTRSTPSSASRSRTAPEPKSTSTASRPDRRT